MQEETGLQELEVGQLIQTTHHIYNQFGKHILKESHWFAMTAIGNEKLVPQTEEDITQIIWVKKEEFGKYFENTFPTIIDVLKHA